MGSSVLLVVGDRRGKVSAGLGKAHDIASAIRKASSYARKHLLTVSLHEERTIAHRILVRYGAAQLLLTPAPKGSGIIAGGAVRTVLQLAGIKDVVGKMLGSHNKITNVYATLKALELLSNEEVRKKS